jgi:purine-binding chemotaxis protein CheW
VVIQYCTFYLEKNLFAVDILDVQEITRGQEVTPIPHAPAYVKGLINLRGQIVMAIDLRTIFSLGKLAPERDPINIIVSLDREPISLIADRAGDVVEFREESLTSPPSPLDESVARLIKGIHKTNGGLLHVLEPAAIFSQSEGIQPHLAHVRASQESK